MHRQGYDLKLTQYDDRGWRATFYTNGDGALAHERHRNRMGANTVAGGPECGAGGAAAVSAARWILALMVPFAVVIALAIIVTTQRTPWHATQRAAWEALNRPGSPNC